MTVKEVVLEAANLVGCADAVRSYFDGGSSVGMDEAAALIRSFNLVENELALDFVDLLAEEKVKAEGGRVKYTALSKRLARVISVQDTKGGKVSFSIFPTALEVGADEVVLRYAYLPDEKGIDDESDYESRVSKGLMAYGVAEAYCACRGLYAEARFWEKKYKAALVQVCGKSSGGRIRGRKWI